MPPPSLTVFVKEPATGTVKTRLAAGIGPDAAATFYRACAERAVAVAASCPATLTIAFAPPSAAAAVRAWLAPLAPHAAFAPQADVADLGDRMRAALAAGLAGGAPVAAVVGSDVPDLSAGAIEAALAALDVAPRPSLVLGPAADGGYWLVGLAGGGRPPPEGLFAGVAWSTRDAAAGTRRSAEAAGVGVVVGGDDVPVLLDVDTVEDLAAWRAASPSSHPLAPAADAALAEAAARHCRSAPMRVRLLLFARARELAGVSEATLEVEAGTTTAGLEDVIVAAYPALQEIRASIVLAVNQAYVEGDERALVDGDEVAVIPPISGG